MGLVIRVAAGGRFGLSMMGGLAGRRAGHRLGINLRVAAIAFSYLNMAESSLSRVAVRCGVLDPGTPTAVNGVTRPGPSAVNQST